MDNVAGRYPVEALDMYDDDGTMPENVDTLRQAVIGRKIISAERDLPPESRGWFGISRYSTALRLTLDNGTQVWMANTEDCCAYTTLESFLLDPAAVDHRIMGVGTTGGYTTWHIYADFGDVMRLSVDWSCGNPFYYGYGFDIKVIPVTVDADVIGGELEDIEEGTPG